jgi:hypothetical protein
MARRPLIAFPFADYLYDPQTIWTRFFNPQFFITYNGDDASIENHVLSRAGSYGKQLGTLLDTVDVLIRHLPTDALTTTERRTLDEFVALRQTVEHAKRDFRGGDHVDEGVDVDRFLDGLERLRVIDPDAHAMALERLRTALPDTTGSSASGDGQA